MRGAILRIGAAVVGLALGWFLVGPRSAEAGDRITYEEILQHLEVGSPPEDIASLVREADEVAVTPEQLEGLKRAGATEALLRLIQERVAKGPSFSLDSVYRMLDDGASGAELVDRILAEGARFDLTARDRQTLIRKKASADVIRALEGTFTYPDHAIYTAEHRLFAIQHPRAWQPNAWYAADGYSAVLSPESGVQRRDDFSLGVQVQASMLGEGDDYTRLPPERIRARDQERFFRRNHELEPQALEDGGSAPQAARVAGYPASLERFTVKMRGVRCLEWMYVVVAEDVLLTVECIAPVEQFAQHEEGFRRMLRTLRVFPDRLRLERRAEALDSAAAVARYRDAVVQVVAEFKGGTSRGSGFFVRSDGFVLTNHHVICGRPDHSRCDSMSSSLLPERVTLVWDRAVEPRRPGEARRQVHAQVLDTVFGAGLLDLALLRAPRATEPYRTIPLSPVGRLQRTGLVRSGDPIVALGFPLPDQFKPDEVMATTGTVARLVTEDSPLAGGGRADRLSFLYMTAQIQPGNSGGPCVSLRTNGVVGLNTTAEMGGGQQLGYFGVCPIDDAVASFPQVKFYPFGRDLPPEGRVELGAMLVDAGNLRAARSELLLALDQADRMAPAETASLYYHLGRCLNGMEVRELAEEAFRKCLESDPDHAGALASLAYLQPSDHIDRAFGFVERLVRVHGDDYTSYYHRAEFRRRARQFDKAQEDLTRALELGGHRDPAVYRLRGLTYLDADECGAGVEAYRKALAEDSRDFEAELGIVECAVRSKDLQGALLEYARIAEAHPEEALVQETYGRFLATQPNRREDGIERMVAAVRLLNERGQTPGPRLLLDAANLSLEADQGVRAVALAVLLHGLWPGWRGLAHETLAEAWLGVRPALGRAHVEAARRIGFGSSIDVTNAPLALFSLEDVSTMVLSRYHPAVLFDVLEESSLGFNFDFDVRFMTPEAIAEFQRAGWGPTTVQAANARFRLDQMQGSAALGAQVGAKIVSGDARSAANAPWNEVTFTNRSKVALTGFRIRYLYYDKAGEVLWETTADLQNRMPPLLPGETRQFPFVWHTWEHLRGRGAPRDRIDTMEFRVVSARNAYYLGKVLHEGAFDTDRVYGLRFQNGSMFHLKDLWVRVDYVDGDGRPVLGESGRFRGQPIHRVLPVKNVVLAPGEVRQVNIPDLDDAATLVSLGWPRQGVPGASVQVKIVEAVPFEP